MAILATLLVTIATAIIFIVNVIIAIPVITVTEFEAPITVNECFHSW